ncbi:MAG: endolytic transglycosylase MltG [Bacteroidales bacterium]
METKILKICNNLLSNKRLKLATIILLILSVATVCLWEYMTCSKTINKENVTVFIYPNDTFETIHKKLIDNNIIGKSNSSFATLSKTLQYHKHIRVGHYIIKPETPIIKLIGNLRSGNQQPINLVILTARTSDDFAQKVCKHLMITPQDLMREINEQGFKHSNTLFENIIPNTYEVYWTISAKDLLKKLQNESELFWRKNQNFLKQSQLTKQEIIILASIVSEETSKKDEMPMIAGVYINRLKKSMRLQADPTVKFAIGDFTLKRITGKHLQIDSKFNTYKYIGLPPAPICLPSVQAIKSVLQYKHHNYIFFCAKEDFSGYHNFATTHKEHIQNAIRYRKALNSKGIN